MTPKAVSNASDTVTANTASEVENSSLTVRESKLFSLHSPDNALQWRQSYMARLTASPGSRFLHATSVDFPNRNPQLLPSHPNCRVNLRADSRK